MIKVGIECESIEKDFWGIARLINKLLEEIDKRPELKHEFKFFLYFKSSIPDHPYLQNEIFVKKIVKPPLVPASFSLYYYVWLPIKLWFDRPDAMYFPNYMLPIIFRGKSLVTLTEDAYFEMNRTEIPFRYRLAYRMFSNWAARHATRVLAILNSSKPKISKLFKIEPERIVIVPNGIDTPPPGYRRLSGGEDYIFYLGQAFSRRHLRETILAFEKIKPKFPKLKLIAVGRDKYNPPIIKDLVREVNARLGHDAIIYKDFLEQKALEDTYAGAKAFIYAADPNVEAFGLPPLEALAYGVPPIVTRMDATKEIFGDNAFFVENPNSVEEIATAMTEALTNEAKREKIFAHSQEIAQRFTWQKHTDRFLETVREIASK